MTMGAFTVITSLPSPSGPQPGLCRLPALARGIGLHYYLRIMVAIIAVPLAVPAAGPPGPPLPVRSLAASRLGHALLAALVLLLIGPGAHSAPLLTLIRATASMVAR